MRFFLLLLILGNSIFAQIPLDPSQLIDSIKAPSDDMGLKRSFLEQILKENQKRSLPLNTIAETYHELGRLSYNTDKNQALTYFNKALYYRTKGLDKSHIDIARTSFNLGILLNDLNQIQESITHFTNAGKIYKSNKNATEFYTYYWIGKSFNDLGEYELASNYLNRAIIGSKTAGDFYTYFDSKNEKGNQFIHKENYKEAILFFEGLEKELVKKTSDPNFESLLGIVYYNLSIGYEKNSNFGLALANSQKALKFLENTEENYRLAYCYRILGTSQLNLGNYNDAEKNLKKALSFITNDKTELTNDVKSRTFLALGQLSHIKHMPQLAENYFKKMFAVIGIENLRFMSKNNTQAKLFTTLSVIEDYYPFETRETNKLKLLQFADQLIDATRNSYTQTASKVYWREKTHRFYENAIALCFKEKNYEKAFYFIEKNRAILLLDALKELDAKQFLTQEQRGNEQTLRYKMIGLQNKFATLNESDENYNATLNVLIASQENYQKFIKKIEATNPQFKQLKYNNTYLTLKQVQALVKKNKQTFLSYFVGESSVYAMRISAEKVILKEIDKMQFLSLITNFSNFVSKPLTKSEWADYQNVAFELFSLIVKPFDLQNGNLIISADGFSIPFEALLAKPNGTKSDFFLHRHAISYAYSANVFFKEITTPFFASTRMLGIAPVKFQPKLGMPSLVGSNSSLSKIENEYFSGKLMTDKDATKSAFLSNLKGYGIIQLFTHGKAENGQETPMIYFEDETLKLSEFNGLGNSDARLVVLSACETGVGQTIKGEGIQSIARGFSFLGIPSVVTTLWSVNSTSTYALTENFYSFLKKGQNKDLALQNAKISYLQNSNEFAPFYWAGMVLVGDTSALATSRLWYVLLAAIIILAIVFWLIFKRKKSPKV